MVTCKVLLGGPESTVKTSTYVSKLTKTFTFQLNILPGFAWKVKTCKVRKSSACHLFQGLHFSLE